MDAKMDFLREVLADLADGMDAETMRRVQTVLSDRLSNYDMRVAERGLIVVETQSEQWLKLFLATKKVEGKSEKTLYGYERLIRRMMRDTGKPLAEINVFVLRSYLAKREMAGCSINTIATVRYVLKSLFGWLHREGFIPNDPSAQLGAVKMVKNLEQPFSQTELEQLRIACGENLRDRALLEFLRASGCRVNEAALLNESDVNLDKMTARVFGKGSKWRIVYLDEVAVMHIKMYLADKQKRGMALFSGRGSERITTGAIRAMLKRLEEISGVSNVHPHRFRRTLTTTMIRRGMPVQDVACVLGHSKLDTTMKYVYMDDGAVEAEYRRRSV